MGADGTVFAAINAGVLHALDPATGADRWTFDGRGNYGTDLSTTPAVLASGTVLWPGPHNTLHALFTSGTLLWSERFRGFVLLQRRDAAVDLGGVVQDHVEHVTARHLTALPESDHLADLTEGEPGRLPPRIELDHHRIGTRCPSRSFRSLPFHLVGGRLGESRPEVP